VRPVVAPPAPWHFPDAEQFSLGNGMAVWAFNLPGQHVVTAQIVFDLPLDVEPADREGVATIAVRTSDEGTVDHPQSRIAELIEDAGASYDGQAGSQATVCSLDVPRTRLRQALPLFGELLRKPAYAATDVDRQVALRLAEIEQGRANPGMTASLAARSVLYDPASRESRPSGGTTDTVSAVDRDLVTAFHDANWLPASATLIIAGELDPDPRELAVLVTDDWSGGTGHEHQPPMFAGPSGPGVVWLVDRPGSVQSEIRVVGRAVDRNSPAWASLQVGCTALGGSFGSRLNSILREQRGYTYGASLSATPARIDGSWTLATSVRTEVTVDALTDALAVLRLDDDLTAAEVSDAINYQLGIAPLRYETADGVVRQASALASVGISASFVNTHFANVAAVTPESATGSLRDWVRPDLGSILVVGDAEALRSKLGARGFEVRPLSI